MHPINNNLINLIVDSGSYKNIITKHTTNKLKIPLEPH
jgi:hypothetical protein